MSNQSTITQSTQSSTLADILERVLDKGIVIAGDIRVKLVEIELLTIQIRLVICSVDKAKEIGMDWWTREPLFAPRAQPEGSQQPVEDLEKRLAALESAAALRPAA